MARLEIPILLDSTDLHAFYRDLEAVLLKYGIDEEDCPPHLRKERSAEVKRCMAALGPCIRLGDE